MTDGREYPPPGGYPPPVGPPSGPALWAPPAQHSGVAAPPWPAYDARAGLPSPSGPGPVHSPGAVPLRPLTLGTMYDGAFRIIRYNPKATLGATVLVCTLFMLVPVVVSTVMSFVVGAGPDLTGDSITMSDSQLTSVLASAGSLLIGLYGTQLGLVFVTGMIAHVTHAAAVGRKLTLGEAWAATAGKRWRLVGLALLLGLCTIVVAALLTGVVVVVALTTHDVLASVLVGIVCVVGYLLGLAVFWTRVICLSSTALVLEPVGVIGAMRRAVELTRGQFWRVLGIGLLTAVVAGLAGSILGTPITIVGEVLVAALPTHALLILSIMYALSTVASNAFTAPFTSAVTALQYLDQRIRKEAYDVELMRQAGLLGP